MEKLYRVSELAGLFGTSRVTVVKRIKYRRVVEAVEQVVEDS